MDKPASPFRNLGLSAVGLCLAATFGFSVTSLPTLDRVNRQQQRTRVQRHPRHRMCPGVSQETCDVRAAAIRVHYVSEPPRTAALIVRPALSFLDFVVQPVLARAAQRVVFPVAFPRPPPVFA